MSSLSRLKASPGLLIRALVALGAAAAIAAAAARFAAGRPALGADVAEESVVLLIVGALARRFGVALPGNGFASYMLGVMAYAMLDRGWPFGVVVALVAMVVGDVALRRLPLAAALDNAAHLTAGGAAAGLVYERLGGTTGAAALAAANLPPLVIFLLLVPLVVNATFYLELARSQGLGQAIARDISLAKSFPRIQELARRLVPWEHMGFARYDAATNEMELIADTADTPGGRLRYDAAAGLTSEVLRLRRPV